jgi:hypothetical protein
MPCLKHYRAIFKRFKLKSLYTLNIRVYVYVLLRVLQVTLTQGGEAAKLLVAARSPLTIIYFKPTKKV